MIPMNIQYLLNTAQSSASALGPTLVGYTRVLNEVAGANAVDRFMDASVGMGHRIVHGHSLDNLPAIFSAHGLEGVSQYFSHGFKDVMSPHGMPIPFANEIKNYFGMTTGSAIDWLCFNIGDLMGGAMAVGHSYFNFHTLSTAVAAGSLSNQMAINSLLSVISKMGMAILIPNPITFAAGLFDAGALTWAVVSIGGLSAIGTASTAYGEFYISGAVAGASSALLVGGLISYLEGRDKESWLERAKKYSLAGAIGGVCGVAVSAYSSSAAVIGGAAIGGYIVGEKIVDAGGEWLDSMAVRRASEPVRMLPEMLEEAYC